jgi:hypothetical protein
VLASVRRDRATGSTSLSNGYYTVSGLVVPRSVTGVTKVRFYVIVAGTASTGTAVSLSLYHGSTLTALTRVATAPVTQSTFTSTGVKELTLSASVNLTAGQRLAWMTYLPAGAFMAAPSLACTPVAPSPLINAGTIYAGYKAAAAAAPVTLDITTGWTGDVTRIWWALL